MEQPNPNQNASQSTGLNEASSPPPSRSSASEDSQGMSQNTLQHTLLLQKMVDDQAKRRSLRRSNITKSYDKDVAAVKEGIEKMFIDHEAESAKVHASQMKRLQHCIQRKAEIEALMEAKTKKLREAYMAHSKDLEAAARVRGKEL